MGMLQHSSGKKVLVFVEGDANLSGLYEWRDMRKNIIADKDWKLDFQLGSALYALGYEVWFCALTDLKDVKPVCQKINPSIVFQYCEAIAGDRNKEVSLVNILEDLGVLFTGEPSKILALCKDKYRTKAVVSENSRVLTLPSMVLRFDDLKHLDTHIRKMEGFCLRHQTGKLILKPNRGEASECLHVVEVSSGKQDVTAAFRKALSAGYNELIVEPFVRGVDLTCGLLNTDHGLVSIGGYLIKQKSTAIRAGLTTYTYDADLKFSEQKQKEAGLRYYSLAKNHPEILKSLSSYSLGLANAMGVQSYMRLDFRMGADGHLFFLEANPNPSLGRGDEFALAAKEAGYTYPQILTQILKSAQSKASGRIGQNAA